MNSLKLVKPLSQLREERKISRETSIEVAGLQLLRGSITELSGKTCVGKTSYANALLAKLTRAGEVCAIIDANGAFDPVSADTAGIVLENLLWIKCAGDLKSTLKSTDLLLQAKGFGAVWINLGILNEGMLSSVPNSFWYRFRTLVKGSPTLLIVTTRRSILGSAAQHSYGFSKTKCVWKGNGKFKLIKELRTSLHSKHVNTPVISRVENVFKNPRNSES